MRRIKEDEGKIKCFVSDRRLASQAQEEERQALTPLNTVVRTLGMMAA